MGVIYRNSTLYGGGGSGSGGHNILDTDGNSLPQEDNLQFKGLSVTDNSTDEITEVEALGLNQDDLDELSTEGITTGFVQSAFNYSTEEQIVGRWVDGKPLYQKTIITTTPAGGSETTKYVPIGAQVDMGFNVISVVTDQTGHWFSSFNRSITDASQIFRVNVFSNIEADNPNTLRVDCSVTQWVNRPLWATIRYTKTTD